LDSLILTNLLLISQHIAKDIHCTFGQIHPIEMKISANLKVNSKTNHEPRIGPKLNACRCCNRESNSWYM